MSRRREIHAGRLSRRERDHLILLANRYGWTPEEIRMLHGWELGLFPEEEPVGPLYTRMCSALQSRRIHDQMARYVAEREGRARVTEPHHEAE